MHGRKQYFISFIYEGLEVAWFEAWVHSLKQLKIQGSIFSSN